MTTLVFFCFSITFKNTDLADQGRCNSLVHMLDSLWYTYITQKKMDDMSNILQVYAQVIVDWMVLQLDTCTSLHSLAWFIPQSFILALFTDLNHMHKYFRFSIIFSKCIIHTTEFATGLNMSCKFRSNKPKNKKNKKNSH